MRRVNPKNLTSIVDFIYHGEVNVDKEDLNYFMALAAELELKGLTGSAKYVENKLTIEHEDKTEFQKDVIHAKNIIPNKPVRKYSGNVRERLL